MFSFMGEQHGRMFLAHFDGVRLVVHMSRLHRFHVEDEESLLLFARFLASDVDSLDSTTRFPKSH